MKILFVESALSGHRSGYHHALIQGIGEENCILITPEYENNLQCLQIVNNSINLRPRTFIDYKCWLLHIQNTAYQYHVTCIHILDGDLLYRFFGYGLEMLKPCRIIVTFHHIKQSILHSISVNRILKHIYYGVVHTIILQRRFHNRKCLSFICYPYLGKGESFLSEESKAFFGIDKDKKVFLLLGGLRYEKGADLLISALQNVSIQKDNITVLIAGAEEYFTKESLEKKNNSEIQVVFYSKFLTEREWAMALSAADWLILPYRKGFTGASGPLSDGVWYRKGIIAPIEQNIGKTVVAYHLGLTFSVENTRSLGDSINLAIQKSFSPDDLYELFRNELAKNLFIEKYRQLYYEPKQDHGKNGNLIK